MFLCRLLQTCFLLSFLINAPMHFANSNQLLSIARETFGDSSLDVESKTLFISKEQKQCMVQQGSSDKLSDLLSYYAVLKNKKIIGYILMRTHRVRTLYEKIAIFFDKDAFVRRIDVLEFHEPSQYRSPPRWLKQFTRRIHWDILKNKKQIHALTGATLTAMAIKNEITRSSQSIKCLFLQE